MVFIPPLPNFLKVGIPKEAWRVHVENIVHFMVDLHELNIRVYRDMPIPTYFMLIKYANKKAEEETSKSKKGMGKRK